MLLSSANFFAGTTASPVFASAEEVLPTGLNDDIQRMTYYKDAGKLGYFVIPVSHFYILGGYHLRFDNAGAFTYGNDVWFVDSYEAFVPVRTDGSLFYWFVGAFDGDIKKIRSIFHSSL